MAGGLPKDHLPLQLDQGTATATTITTTTATATITATTAAAAAAAAAHPPPTTVHPPPTTDRSAPLQAQREALKKKVTTGIIVTSLVMSILIFVFLVVDESLVLVIAIGEFGTNVVRFMSWVWLVGLVGLVVGVVG